jgi:hypothetical protein
MTKYKPKNEKALRKYLLEFNARVFLKKPKFDKMTESQKEKAVNLLFEYEKFLNDIL